MRWLCLMIMCAAVCACSKREPLPAPESTILHVETQWKRVQGLAYDDGRAWISGVLADGSAAVVVADGEREDVVRQIRDARWCRAMPGSDLLIWVHEDDTLHAERLSSGASFELDVDKVTGRPKVAPIMDGQGLVVMGKSMRVGAKRTQLAIIDLNSGDAHTTRLKPDRSLYHLVVEDARVMVVPFMPEVGEPGYAIRRHGTFEEAAPTPVAIEGEVRAVLGWSDKGWVLSQGTSFFKWRRVRYDSRTVKLPATYRIAGGRHCVGRHFVYDALDGAVTVVDLENRDSWVLPMEARANKTTIKLFQDGNDVMIWDRNTIRRIELTDGAPTVTSWQ